MTETASADILEHVLLPVADPDDARASAEALAPYDPMGVTVVNVVEKTVGAPDKTSVEYSEDVAREAFDTAKVVFPDARERVVYEEDIAAGIFDVAEDIDASAIVFRARGGNRLLQFLAGDRTLKLVTEADRPVIALPSDH